MDINKARARSNKWKHSESGKRWLCEYRQKREVKEHQILYLRVWRQNPLVKEKEREYYGKIKEKLEAKKQTKEWREKRKAWLYSANGRKYLKNQKESLERKTYLKAYNKRWFGSPEGKTYMRIVNNRRRTLTKTGDLTIEQWLKIRDSSPICFGCGRFVECENLTIDHIIPISMGGLHTKANIQALCKSCNSRKHNKLPIMVS